jgi:amino acid transporter
MSNFEIEPTDHSGLRAGALKFPAILMQGITHIAPAVGLILSIQFIASVAGVAAPLAYLLAFFIVLTLGISLTQLARQLPSAGGYYTYISRTVHPRAGFLTAWLYFLYDPTATAINLAFMGFFFESTMRVEFHIWCPWWLFFLVATAIITVLVYRGVAISTGTIVVLGAAEIAIVIALSLFGVVHPGAGGINLNGYLPSHAPSRSGLYLGIVFSIFSFTGFDAVAPLAEESEHPRRNLPRAIIGSILCMGVFYVFCSWAVMVGWGTHAVAGLVASTENPCFVLARKLWGKGWILVFVAVLNSILAVSIAGTNAATRVFFAMSRSGALPALLKEVHPLYRTPVNAIRLQTAITLAVGLGLGWMLGPDQEYYFMGVVVTLGLVFVYSAGNYGVYRFYGKEKKQEFSVWKHVICPALSTASLLWVGVKSVVPLPASPLQYAPVVVAVWLVAGCAIIWWMKQRGSDLWLVKAGEVFGEEQASQESHTLKNEPNGGMT